MSVVTVDRRMHVAPTALRIQHLRRKSHDREGKNAFPPRHRRQESKLDVSDGKPGSVNTPSRWLILTEESKS